MFIYNYLDDTHKKLLSENYTDKFLNSIDEHNFKEIYILLEFMGFYYIDDLIVRYLEIFTEDKNYVLKKILTLKDKLGIDYIEKIGDNLNLFRNAFKEDL